MNKTNTWKVVIFTVSSVLAIFFIPTPTPIPNPTPPDNKDKSCQLSSCILKTSPISKNEKKTRAAKYTGKVFYIL